jgi:hypothetical protein
MADPQQPPIDSMPRRSTRALSLCLVASLALHLLIVSELPGISLRVEPAAPNLSAELVTVQPAPAPVAKSPPPAKPYAAETPAPTPTAAPLATPTPVPVVVDPPAEAAVQAAADLADAEPIDQAEGMAQQAADAPSEPAEPDVAAATMPQEQPSPPQTGTIRYEVYLGSDKFSIGRSVQTWSIDKHSYRLTSFSETTGLVGLFKPYQFAYTAEGQVELGGLRPESFTVQRGRGGKHQATAHFDWSSGQLTFGSIGDMRTSPLNSSSYDFLTLFYQLPRMGLAPGRVQVSITTGTKFRSYQLEIGAEEMLELPIGTMRTIPIKQVRVPGEESIEVWLAPEERYLPVRIRFLNEKGKMTAEQVATQIEFETVATDGH